MAPARCTHRLIAARRVLLIHVRPKLGGSSFLYRAARHCQSQPPTGIAALELCLIGWVRWTALPIAPANGFHLSSVASFCR